MPEKTAQKETGKKPKPQQEVIVHVPLSKLHDFPNHPFKVRDDEAMLETAESIRQYGVLVPAIVRPREDGGYEIVAGHRRKHGSELAGLQNLPCIVREMDDDTATILMVDSNIQRENILPSERAQAYKMKLEAIKRQGARTDLTSPQVAAKFRADDEVAKGADVSGDTVRRYIRLTELSPELQQMVDEKKIGISTPSNTGRRTLPASSAPNTSKSWAALRCPAPALPSAWRPGSWATRRPWRSCSRTVRA